MIKCDRCLKEYEKLEKVTYNVKCADGILEFPANYCTSCADECENTVREEKDEQDREDRETA
jgi:hypothetical protein|tara:strand:+ start:107 stop:292 length:186 start_codon:yes stop_codon:yes gene_type:complete